MIIILTQVYCSHGRSWGGPNHVVLCAATIQTFQRGISCVITINSWYPNNLWILVCRLSHSESQIPGIRRMPWWSASNADSHVCKLCTLCIQLELNFLKMASKFSSTSRFIDIHTSALPWSRWSQHPNSHPRLSLSSYYLNTIFTL
jgi:hypothetical protein